MHATAGIQEVPPDFQWTPDPERLARELEVDMFVANTGRIWTFDEGELQGGYIIDFDGARMCWVGEMQRPISSTISRRRTCPPCSTA